MKKLEKYYCHLIILILLLIWILLTTVRWFSVSQSHSILATKLLLGFNKLECNRSLSSNQKQTIRETVIDFLFMYKDRHPCSSGNPVVCCPDYCVDGPDADPDIFDKVTRLLARLICVGDGVRVRTENAAEQ